MPLLTFLIDLDETLYPAACGIWNLIGDRIDLFMQEHVSIPEPEVSAIRQRLFHTYGTTLRGLQIEYGIDPEDYLAYVHDVPIEALIPADPSLNTVLDQFPQPKWIFTNADRAHARRVLRALQAETAFTGIIDILDQAPYCKPMLEAFQLGLRKAGVSSPQTCVLVDDTPRNLTAARGLGMFTVQVGGQPYVDAHLHIPTIHDLPSVLTPELMEAA